MNIIRFASPRRLSTLIQSSHTTPQPQPQPQPQPLSSSVINSQVKALIQQSQYLEALKLFSPVTATRFTFPSLLKACTFLSKLNYGKTIHSIVLALGLQSDPYIITSLINLYVKCGSLDDAVKVFDDLRSTTEALIKDTTVWNSIIDGFFRYGNVEEGILRFHQMQLSGVKPDEYTLSILLGACGRSLQGKQIHGYTVRNVPIHDVFLETALLDMYFTVGRAPDSLLLFDKLENRRNIVIWNVMISGLCDNGLSELSLKLYSLAKNENIKLVSATFSCSLTACGIHEDAEFGKQIHCDVIKLGCQEDSYVLTSLLTMYAKCKLMESAEVLFTLTQSKGIETWNAMITAYVSNGYANDALKVYGEKKRSGILSDHITLSNILSACSFSGLLSLGKSIHTELIKRPLHNNVALQSALLTMYFKCGSNEDAHFIFSNMTEKDIVVWGSMISGLCQNIKYEEAFLMFNSMENDGVNADSDIMASVISACAGLRNVLLGFGIHGFVMKRGFELDAFVTTSLIDMYSKFGLPEDAANVFAAMPYRNLVAWNSLMSCYCRNELPELSISTFSHIIEQGWKPDSVSITTLLSAVADLASLLRGKAVHTYLLRLEISMDLQVENVLIDMYVKSGCLNYAQRIFDSMTTRRNLVTWNSMISGYGYHGNSVKALELFTEMTSLGIAPDRATFMSLISSCRHSGMVREGLNLFDSMRLDHKIEPRMEDHVNIVDLLGRAGHLNDAYNFIQGMPIAPDKSVWLCLLSASRVHHNVELGDVAASNLLMIEPSEGSNYVPLLNLYGGAGLCERAANLRVLMKEQGLKKTPGCSWIEVNDKVDVFFSGDSSSLKIHDILTSLSTSMGKKIMDDNSVDAF